MNQLPQLSHFFDACFEIQSPCEKLFTEAATELDIEEIFSTKQGCVPTLLKVVKYFPSYVTTRPHYDGLVFSMFLDSKDHSALLLSPYKFFFTADDLFSPKRKLAEETSDHFVLLIPGTLLSEFSIYPTPYIVIQSDKTRYTTIAFAMRTSHIPQKFEFSSLPNLKIE